MKISASIMDNLLHLVPTSSPPCRVRALPWPAHPPNAIPSATLPRRVRALPLHLSIRASPSPLAFRQLDDGPLASRLSPLASPLLRLPSPFLYLWLANRLWAEMGGD